MSTLHAKSVERLGTALLVALFVASLAATLTAAAVQPALMPVIPMAAVALGAAFALLRSPVTGIVTAIVLSAGLTGYDSVSQGGEVVFVLFGGAYMLVWYGSHLISGTPLVRSWLDAVMAVLVFGGLGGGIALALASGADGQMMIGEARSFAMLVFYFPVREMAATRDTGGAAVAGALITVGLVAVGWNAYNTWSAFANADQVWQIIDVRVAYGETTLTASLMLALMFLVASRRRTESLAFSGIVAAVLLGFILTKSRGFWAAFAVGALWLLVVLRSDERKRLVKSGLSVFVSGLALAYLAFGPYVYLMAIGIVKRFQTLESAGSTDVSLINRFRESGAVWSHIQQNPILGHGFGAPFSRYDLIYSGTINVSFVHNGYLGTWYKIGFWGLALVVVAWLGSIWRSARAASGSVLSLQGRALAAAASGTLVALAIAANTSNPFMLADQTLVIAVMMGLANGFADRARDGAALDVPQRP